MRKFFILFIILGFTVSLNAQDFKNLKIEKVQDYKTVWNDGTSNLQTAIPFTKGGVPIGSSQNIYSIMLAGPHQVMYNADINTVVFVHRALDSGGGQSGELAFDFSTDGGDTWTTEAWISQNQQGDDASARYPSITIYNPPGNTNVADARIVANGPALEGYNPYVGWAYSFEVDATIEANPTTNEFWGSNNGDNTDFHPYGLEMGPDGTAWSMSASYNATSAVYLDNFYVNKAVYNDGTDQFDWTSPLFTIVPDFKYTGDDRLISAWDIAVHPTDPDIVYAVIGCLETGDTRDVPSPHIWKTIDGGANWTALDPIDFSQEPLYSQMDEYIIYNEGEPLNPYVRDMDATVDANGVLHLFSEVYSGALDIGYVYGVGDADQSFRHYMDFTVTDGTDWEMTYINDIECEAATWVDVATYLHSQVSRNLTGTDIFYTWSETFQDADSFNTAPNMMAAWWNVNDGLKYDSLNLTAGTAAQGICYFPQVSPILIEHAADQFEVPMVIALIDFANGGPTDQADYMYLTDFMIQPPLSVNNISSKPEVMIYPNPVSGNVYVSVGAKVELYNILGAKILTVEGQSEVTQIDMSKYAAGTYLLKVFTDEGIVTKKIQKVD